jgi:predicted acylesterase/phospholipase RssA
MRAFAILDGGGVKGAALAGALKAAQDRGIEFAGYGGTSAGSIVALLACAGYTGAELQAKFVDELDFASPLTNCPGYTSSHAPAAGCRSSASPIVSLTDAGGTL